MTRLKNLRAVAARYDKRACDFHGGVTVAAIRLWLVRDPLDESWR
ncbi:hypothetical protein [Streptomyces mirabilis]